MLISSKRPPVPAVALKAFGRAFKQHSDVIAYQQQAADTFFKLGLLPKQLDIKEAAQAPKQ